MIFLGTSFPLFSAIKCPPLNAPLNGSIHNAANFRTYSSFGAEARYSCDHDFKLSDESAVRICMMSNSFSVVGVWSGAELKCDRKFITLCVYDS